MKNSSGILIGAVVLIVIVLGAFYLWGGTSPASTPNPGGAEASTTGDTTYGHSGVKAAVQTSGYAAVSSTTAVVVGQIIPGPDGAQYWFEYGTTTNFGSSTPVINAAPGQNIIGAGGYLQNLKPNTEYWFRITARNDAGVIHGGPYKLITAAK
ncbi:MAG TPA: hypothetical protein VMT80_01705 [Candidatus Paceibacterota bacterium]|nr:hypothetical protein [Candidatus Paceibacterota bacterium]